MVLGNPSERAFQAPKGLRPKGVKFTGFEACYHIQTVPCTLIRKKIKQTTLCFTTQLRLLVPQWKGCMLSSLDPLSLCRKLGTVCRDV